MATVKDKTPVEKAFAFLALLITSLPEDYYSADAGRWATAILNLRNKYGTEYPHLFRYIHFRNAPRSDSYSPEVSNFLAFLQFTDATIVHNPGFTRMQLQEQARQLLRDRYEQSLSPKDVSAIEQMAKEIITQIKVGEIPK